MQMLSVYLCEPRHTRERRKPQHATVGWQRLDGKDSMAKTRVKLVFLQLLLSAGGQFWVILYMTVY